MNKKNNIDIEFILVEPSHPGNIGACARAIKNMGFKKLALVNPRKEISEEAFHRAKGAKDILQNVKIYQNPTIYDSFVEALKEKNLIFATIERERTISWPTFSVHKIDDEVKNEIRSLKSKIAVVFGREDNGLSNKELQKCDYHLIIPTNDEYSSLNLSHALQIVSFELMKIVTSESKFMPDEKEFVTSEENEQLILHLM